MIFFERGRRSRQTLALLLGRDPSREPDTAGKLTVLEALDVETAASARATAEESYRIEELRYRKGSGTVTDSLLAQAAWLESRANELAALDKRQEQDKVAELRADLAAARTALATQEAVYRRDRSLFQAKAISQEALDPSLAVRDSAGARVTSAEESLQSAQTELSYTRITAPFTGVITERLADPGDLALPGRAILAMEAPERGYFVSVKVPQDLFPKLELGGEALCRCLQRRGGRCPPA